jgi:hypothetical protein
MVGAVHVCKRRVLADPVMHMIASLNVASTLFDGHAHEAHEPGEPGGLHDVRGGEDRFSMDIGDQKVGFEKNKKPTWPQNMAHLVYQSGIIFDLQCELKCVRGRMRLILTPDAINRACTTLKSPWKWSRPKLMSSTSVLDVLG